MVYKALISDIDNTLVGIKKDGTDIDDATVAAAKGVLERGVHIGLASGRGWHSTKSIATRLGIVDPCIVEGGGSIVDPQTEQILWQKLMSGAVSQQVVEVFQQHSPSGALVKSSGAPDRRPIQDAGVYKFENRVIYLLGVTREVAESVASRLSEIPEIAAHLTTPSWAGVELYDVHVTSKEGTKQHALEKWRELVGVTQDECIGMGDSANDMPLFAAVGVKVAVGNASDDLKRVADYIAPNTSDGALRAVLSRYFS